MLHVGNQKGRIKGEKMKSVLISVRPKWCKLIASGKKTIEVRKTRPKIETPFTVYVYMTKHKWIFKLLPFLKNRFAKVIGEFVCDRIICCQAYYGDSGKKHLTNLFGVDTSKICLSELEIFDYIIGKDKKDGIGWLWHISDLKIYEKPKELGEFGNYKTEWIQWYHSDDKVFYPLTRPPQSWCYVEEI